MNYRRPDRYQVGRFRKSRTTFGRRKCFNCHREGQIAPNCPRTHSPERNAVRNEDANHAYILMATPRKISSNKLLLDSGASDHMVMNPKFFIKLESIAHRTIVLEHGSTAAAKQQGDIRFRIKNRNNGTKKTCAEPSQFAKCSSFPISRQICCHVPLYV